MMVAGLLSLGLSGAAETGSINRPAQHDSKVRKGVSANPLAPLYTPVPVVPRYGFTKPGQDPSTYQDGKQVQEVKTELIDFSGDGKTRALPKPFGCNGPPYRPAVPTYDRNTHELIDGQLVSKKYLEWLEYRIERMRRQ